MKVHYPTYVCGKLVIKVVINVRAGTSAQLGLIPALTSCITYALSEPLQQNVDTQPF